MPDPETQQRVEHEMASHVMRARIALALVGILFAWTAYGNYDHLKPWRDGTMFDGELTGDIKQLVDLSYFLVVFTGVASVANIVLAAIAGKRTMLAIGVAVGIFAVYAALRLYQTNGRCLSNWLWWLTALVIGIGVQAAFKANQVRKSQRIASARLVG